MNYPRSNRRSKKQGDIPTYKITYEQHELDALLALEKPKKKKDKSHVQCHHCKEMGHYANECPEKKKKQRNKQEAMIPKEKKDVSQVMCFKCKELGHYANFCPEKMKHKINQPMKDLSLVTCFKCENKGHYADVCPEKFPQDPKKAKM